MVTKWIGDAPVEISVPFCYGLMATVWIPVYVEVEPKYEIVDGEMVGVASEFMGYDNEGNEVYAPIYP